MLHEWMTKAVEISGVTQTALSRLMTRKLKRSISVSAINKMLSNARAISGDELLAIADITGFPLPFSSKNQSQIEIVGTATAGGIVRFYSEEIFTDQLLAIEIQGDWFGPLFDHWLIHFENTRYPASKAIDGHLCVLCLEDGRVLVRQLRQGSRRAKWTLVSNFDPPIYDTSVRWACRVRQISPK